MSRQKPPPYTMADPKLENKMKDLKIKQDKEDLNILLLGETGVGKSTLINAFANYLSYNEFKKARKEKLLVLIPTLFEIEDKHGERHVISTGQGDENEFLETGESATQDVKTYVFPIWNGEVKIRLIDCPGMGDKRGTDQDDINSENILNYIANLHKLHAICYLLKPTESRDTTVFRYCINQIFSRLDKSATDNLVFCFTHTRGTDYKPGETERILEKTIKEIGSKPPFAKIPLGRNIFCFDNEPFRYLAAVHSSVEFSSEVKDRNKESWNKSAKQCWNLIKYITGDTEHPPLKPHHVKSTNAVNEARRMINHLAQPLADISQLIHHNMSVLARHKDNLAVDTGVVEEMKKQLYMPVITLDTINLTQPVTVCTSDKCADIYPVGGKQAWHYRQRCHDPCYLRNVPKEIIGAAELINCASMSCGACTKCLCEYRKHMHVYYLTKTKEIQERDENVQKNITTREQLMQSKKKIVRNIEIRQGELDKEHHQIVEICAIFAHFLQNNAITPFNDAYKDYIEYLIERETSLGKLCDEETVNHLMKLLFQYVEIKQRFDEHLKTSRAIGRNDIVSPKDIKDNIEKLYNLKHNGKKIKELYECQKKSRGREHQNTEYVHKIPFKKDEKKNGEKGDDKKSKEKKGDKKDKEKDKKDKEKDNKEKKGGENKSRDKTRNETQRSRAHSPPPSYQEAHRNQNYDNRGPYSQYSPHGGANYHPSAGGNYPPAGGPPYPPYTPYPPGPYGQQPPGPSGYPPHSYGPPSDPYRYGHDYKAPDGNQRDTISITVKKEPGPNPHFEAQQPQPHPHYPHQYPQPPYDPNYSRHPPNPNYPFDPNNPNYNHPPYHGSYYPPPLLSQPVARPPHVASQPYDHHHGVNRQRHEGGQHQGTSGSRGNNQGRGGFKGGKDAGGGFKGGKDAGGVHKKNRTRKHKNDKENEQKKSKKKNEKKSSDSDSDNSSSS